MFAWTAVVVGVILLDQISKYLTVLYVKPVDAVTVIPDILRLRYAENTGMAFSLFDGPGERWIFMSISTVALAAVTLYMFAPRPRWLADKFKNGLPPRPQGWLLRLSFSLILGGGIGNMIDRFALGYVVDMIDVYCINFAVFNVADSFVCVGAGLIMLYLITEMVKETKAERAAVQAAVGEDNEHE